MKRKLWKQILAVITGICVIGSTTVGGLSGLPAAAAEAKTYLSFGVPAGSGLKAGWYMGSTAYPLQLYKVDSTSATTGTLAETVTSGSNYFVVAPSVQDNPRALFYTTGQDATAQVNATLSGDSCNIAQSAANCIWTITGNETDGYTLESATVKGKYLNHSGNHTSYSDYAELPVNGTQDLFSITATGDKQFYITVGEDPEKVTTDYDDYGADIVNMFNSSDADNLKDTWVIAGGEAAEGGFAQTGGARNYGGHFEEYIRWSKTAGDQKSSSLQRYVINTAQPGLSVKEYNEQFTALVDNFHPRAVAYLLGKEDLALSNADFTSNLKSLIEKVLKVRDNTDGYFVLQLPYATKDDETNQKIETLIKAVDTVLAGLEAQKNRIVVVDHYTLTKSDNDFLTNGLQKDGITLTEAGHLTLGAQLANATANRKFGASAVFPMTSDAALWKNLPTLEAPTVYSEVTPTVTATNDALNVSISEGSGGWQYTLHLANGTVVSGEAAENSFTVSGLPTGQAYILIIRSADGSTQLTTVKGAVKQGDNAVKNTPELLTGAQKAIADKIADNKPMTWLFMGDSITHGAAWTHGYDSISQLLDKYLDSIGRHGDVIINTAVSGSKAYESGGFRGTIQHLDERLNQYKDAAPDVVAIMLGTNDGESAADYNKYITQIIEAIRKVNANAIIVLRTPTAAIGGDYVNKGSQYGPELKKLAEADPAHIIYSDQHSEMNQAMTTYSWIKGRTTPAGYIFGDNNIHPGPVGQLAMLRDFVTDIGIWTEDSPITNLYYRLLTAESSKAAPAVSLTNGSALTVSVTALEALYGNTDLGEVTLAAKSATSGEVYTVSANTYANGADADPVLSDLPGGEYEVTVSAVAKEAATRVTFAPVTVTVPDSFLPGDVNGDKEVAVPDALKALRAAVGLETLTGNAFKAADMNHSGVIEVTDALEILRMAVGLA